MKYHPLILFGFVPVLSLALSACAAGPGPDLRGPQGPTLTAAYSGNWVLLRTESDDLAAKLRRPSGGRSGFPPGGMVPGGRGGGGGMGARPGGGGMGGGFPGGGDTEQMRQAMQTMQIISQVPGEMSLVLTPDAVTLTEEEPQTSTLSLGLDTDEQKVEQGLATFFARARWSDKGLEIDRKVDGGGGVKDKISIDANGRLVMKREIENPIRGKVEGTLVYRKQEPGS